MINLTWSRLSTVDYADNVLNVVEQVGDAILTGGVNCMTERKKLYMEFEVETIDGVPEDEQQLLLPGSSIFVNFALFMPISYAYSEPAGPPNTGFNFVIPESVMYTASEMFFYSNGAIEIDTCKNYRAWFMLLTETTFSIELEFYNTFDENGYLNSTAKNNEFRFLSEMWNEANYNEIPLSVYQMSKEIRIMTYIRHSDLAYSEKREITIYQGESQSYNTPTSFVVSDELDPDDLTQISSVSDTAVYATLETGSAGYDSFYAKLIRIQNNGELDFIENAELNENLIEAGNPDANAIKGPFEVTWDGASAYNLVFDIDHEYITAGAKYRIVVMGYREDGGVWTARFGVSGILSESGMVPYCQSGCNVYVEPPSNLLFASGIKDIDNDWTGNELTCSIEERLETYLAVDYSDDRWKNNLDCRGINCGRTAITDNEIRRYLKRVEVEIYTEYTDANLGGTVKNLLDKQTMTRTGTNTYNSPAIVFNFAADILTMSYAFRVRNEINTDCIFTYLNGVGYYPKQDTQYWGGKDVFIKWRLVFEYHDCLPVWGDNIDIIQKLHVQDYDYAGITFEPASVYGGPICTNENKCIEAVLDAAYTDPETYQLINTIEKLPIQGGLEESEAFVPLILARQTSTKFLSQDILYDAADANAQFCINGSQLEEGETYSITAFAKKII